MGSSSKGILWLFFSKFFPPLINFSVFAYTARILAPEDFGLVALALAIVFIVSSFMPAGWRDAIIKYQIEDTLTISSIFWLNLAASLFLSAIIVAFSLLSFFEFQSQTFNLAITILCLKLIFDGLFYTLNIVLLKQQLYSLIALRTICSAVISAIIIIVLLLLDFGVWALIWAQAVLSIANFLAVYLPTRKLVNFQFSLASIVKLNSFAIYSTLTNGVTSALNHYESVIIGGVLGKRELGFYNVAQRLSNIINDIFIGTMNEISFPILAKKQEDLIEFRKAFMNSVYLSVLCLFPLFTFCFISSEKIFLMLFTEKWLNAALVFQVFCVIFIFIILGIPQKNIIVLSNHAKWWFKLQVKVSLVIVPLTAASAYWGLNVLLITLIFGKCLYCSLSMWKSCQLLSLDIKEYVGSFIFPLVCSITSGIITWALMLFIPPSNLVLIDIIVSASIFFITYLVQLFLFDKERIVNIGLILLPKNHHLIRLAKKLNIQDIQ
ncbi:oligosaccharide flippase family protein [Pseudoalteromonas sp. meg-B1]|uniref:oligosaccharide flippase family protein n=1 Tax=Pseudoalteromonas sp. meg-B1 TaxID=2203192 RepID=UPI000D6EF883|nr:oligosaccharide flippase family protein [Pseudoalteromonas sp. meg-B1]PWS56625.1 lipopolysaccharide biosynthesis protein [Pseudoalteromonas sp. meg-B1]